METLESSRVCRLCGQHSGICINIFDKNENHVKKINAVLPILVHEMDLLPKQMCHRCSYKLEEFHKFYSDCLKTDMNLKSQLSWMRKREVKEQIRVPMVQIENVKIKSEPPDYDIYELDPIVENVNYISSMSSMTYSMNSLRNNNDVDSRKITDINERLTCNNRLADCSHCKYNYAKSDSANEAALVNNCKNIKAKRDVRRGPSSMDSGSSSKLNIFRNSVGNVGLKSGHKAKKRSSKEMNGLNAGNISNTNEPAEIKIKTEKPDAIGMRTLRPRKKSVDYLGIKRKKSNLIVNPANICRGIDVTRKTIAKQTAESLVNSIFLDKIKKEPVEQVPSRILRPRKFLINYLGSKREGLPRKRNGTGNKSKIDEVCTKRSESSNAGTLSFYSGKRCTGLISNSDKFKVKQEIISDDEMSNAEENDKTSYNNIVGSCVRNLSNLFDRESEPMIKLEKNIRDEFPNRDWEDKAAGSRENRGSKSSKNVPSKLKPKKVAAKRISDMNCLKYLRSQDLPLRNGKVKKSESNKQPLLRSLNKSFLEIATTRRTQGGALRMRIKESVNLSNVSTSLKTLSNIKHYCEKCCTSFMNKELYMLHACYCD